MSRKISVLFVGTSAERGRLAQQLLADHGCKVSFGVDFSEDDSAGGEQQPDLIAFDAGESGELMLFDRCGKRFDRTDGVKAGDLRALPEAVQRVLQHPAGETSHDSTSVDKLRQLVAGLPGIVFRCGIDEGGKVDFMNTRIEEICGYGRDRFIGRSSRRLLALLAPDERGRLLASVRHSARSGEPFSIEHRIHCADGRVRWLWQRGCVYREKRSNPELESFVVDITDRKKEEEQLSYLANHDALTGVANRSMFLEQVGKSMQRARRHNEMVACLFLDLDRFKQINDTFGHACGDELLQQVSERLRRCIRGNDLVGRLGGDEFAILLDGIAEPQDAAAAARKILDELDRVYIIRSKRFSISASIGISCYPGDAADGSALLRNADAAMYQVKSSGRHGYRFHANDMSAQAFETLAVANALREAIDTGALQTQFQPRIDLVTGRLACVEALARWQSEKFGSVPPERFISLAEDVGLIGRLGETVLNDACQHMVRWQREGSAPSRISVNLSVQQFRDTDLAERIEAALERSGLAPERLELEINEATLMQDPQISTETLQRLKELNVKLSVDNFGIGYSSLHLLQKFHLDYLKLDRSFLARIPSDKDEVAVTEAIVMMARRLGLRVVAEGVETEEQGVFVRAAGCDEAQGYLFGRPLAGEDVPQHMGRHVH